MPLVTGFLPLPEWARSDRQIFLIGDVHGHAALLEDLTEWISRQEREGVPEIVLLGDMIHRGPESFRTLDLAWEDLEGFERTLLPGNHEIALLRFLSGPDAAFDRWVNMGGDGMLSEIHDMGVMTPYGRLRSKIRDRLPRGFEAGMRAQPGYVRRGRLILVHAGVDPYVTDPDAYLARDMSEGPPEFHWSSITTEFSDWTGGWDAFGAGAIVHGHQPILIAGWQDAFRASYEDLLRYRRLNLDFGCGIDRRLGGAEIRGGQIRFFGAGG